MSNHQTDFAPATVPTGIINVDGNPYMKDGTGGMRAVENIPEMKLLIDETIRREFGFAMALADQLRRFRRHLMDNLDALDQLILEKYGAKIGGEKGNRTYTSFDGLWQIKVKIQARLAYGPELQAAKELFDECLNEWAAETRSEMRSIVTNAFNTDNEGQISRSNIQALLKTESEDERWQRGQQAISDAVYTIGSKEYVLFRFRASYRDEFDTLTINLANA